MFFRYISKLLFRYTVTSMKEINQLNIYIYISSIQMNILSYLTMVNWFIPTKFIFGCVAFRSSEDSLSYSTNCFYYHIIQGWVASLIFWDAHSMYLLLIMSLYLEKKKIFFSIRYVYSPPSYSWIIGNKI